MNNYNVLVTADAKRDLLQIFGYISQDLMEPAIADRQLARLEKAIAGLAVLPERCAKYESPRFGDRISESCLQTIILCFSRWKIKL